MTKIALRITLEITHELASTLSRQLTAVHKFNWIVISYANFVGKVGDCHNNKNQGYKSYAICIPNLSVVCRFLPCN